MIGKAVAATALAISSSFGLAGAIPAYAGTPELGCNQTDAEMISSTNTPNGRLVELRFSKRGKYPCAWGRISRESVGDEVWVDRSHDGGTHWEAWLGKATVTDGTSNYGDALVADGSFMRACGNSGGTVTCTNWVNFTKGNVST